MTYVPKHTHTLFNLQVISNDCYALQWAYFEIIAVISPKTVSWALNSKCFITFDHSNTWHGRRYELHDRYKFRWQKIALTTDLFIVIVVVDTTIVLTVEVVIYNHGLAADLVMLSPDKHINHVREVGFPSNFYFLKLMNHATSRSSA